MTWPQNKAMRALQGLALSPAEVAEALQTEKAPEASPSSSPLDFSEGTPSQLWISTSVKAPYFLSYGSFFSGPSEGLRLNVFCAFWCSGKTEKRSRTMTRNHIWVFILLGPMEGWFTIQQSILTRGSGLAPHVETYCHENTTKQCCQLNQRIPFNTHYTPNHKIDRKATSKSILKPRRTCAQTILHWKAA